MALCCESKRQSQGHPFRKNEGQLSFGGKQEEVKWARTLGTRACDSRSRSGPRRQTWRDPPGGDNRVSTDTRGRTNRGFSRLAFLGKENQVWDAHVGGMSLPPSGASVSREIPVSQGLTLLSPRWAHDLQVVKESWVYRPGAAGNFLGAHSSGCRGERASSVEWKTAGATTGPRSSQRGLMSGKVKPPDAQC